MEFSWSPEQLNLFETVVKFAEKELNDDLLNRDKKSEFPHKLWKKCADFGIQGLLFPEQYHGMNLDILTGTLMMEGLGYACSDNGLLFALNAQILSIQMPIYKFGSAQLKEHYLNRLCDGSLIGGHAMTEPESGSDAFALATTAVRKGDHYYLNGAKTFVSNAPVADLFVVFTTTNKRLGFMGITAFIVDRNSPGLAITKTIDKMGLKTAPMGEVFFQDCKVPAMNMLGNEGGGAAIFNDSMDWERGFILAGYVGAMRRQLEKCIKYANERKIRGKSIGRHQAVANMIVDMKVRLENARNLLYKVAWNKQTHGSAGVQASIAKLYISEAWTASCLDAIQVFGGYGYCSEYEIERDLRDAIGSKIYSGTSEIQKNIIAAELGL